MTVPGEIPTNVGTDTDIESLRTEIDELDAAILEAIKRRREVSIELGKVARANGKPRVEHANEIGIIERYGEMGPDGKDLGMLVLRISRGRLGRRQSN